MPGRRHIAISFELAAHSGFPFKKRSPKRRKVSKRREGDSKKKVGWREKTQFLEGGTGKEGGSTPLGEMTFENRRNDLRRKRGKPLSGTKGRKYTRRPKWCKRMR